MYPENPEAVLFLVISWRESPLPNPKFPPEKHPKYQKNIKKCIEFTPSQICVPHQNLESRIHTDPEGTQVIGSMNMGYISDTARNRTHNLFRPKREPIHCTALCHSAFQPINCCKPIVFFSVLLKYNLTGANYKDGQTKNRYLYFY